MADTKPTAATVCQEIADRLVRMTAHAHNLKHYANMAQASYDAGDHEVAKKHLKKALDLEFELFAECEHTGKLSRAWYPDAQL